MKTLTKLEQTLLRLKSEQEEFKILKQAVAERNARIAPQTPDTIAKDYFESGLRFQVRRTRRAVSNRSFA